MWHLAGRVSFWALRVSVWLSVPTSASGCLSPRKLNTESPQEQNRVLVHKRYSTMSCQLDAIQGQESECPCSFPKGMASVSPSQCWHLDPVTADRAKRRSAGGCCTQSRSLRRRQRQEAEEAACLAASFAGCSGDGGLHLYYCQNLAPRTSSEIHSHGWRREKEGVASQTIRRSHNILEVECSKAREHSPKFWTLWVEEALVDPACFVKRMTEK